MSKNVFEHSNKILMQLVKRARGFSKGDDVTFYTSSLVSVVSDYELKITVPIYQSKLIPLNEGDVYTVQFYTTSGFYQCKCVVKGTEKEGQIAVATIRTISALERYQRRQYFRMNCLIPVNYAHLTDYQLHLYSSLKECTTESRRKLIEQQIELENITMNKGTMLDISGGGLRFNSFTLYDKDDVFLVIPEIPQIIDTIPFLLCKEVLIRQVGYQNEMYENKLKFINITNEEREKIITYIFALERERMKNE
ncbi:MAG: flagellar brake domain-containing protein [Lachnospiraceae bacterium]|nr:flagellar brake domain-containing protein [Lachnospiraceae bacterium]